jgi:hypothetical protein
MCWSQTVIPFHTEGVPSPTATFTNISHWLCVPLHRRYIYFTQSIGRRKQSSHPTRRAWHCTGVINMSHSLGMTLHWRYINVTYPFGRRKQAAEPTRRAYRNLRGYNCATVAGCDTAQAVHICHSLRWCFATAVTEWWWYRGIRDHIRYVRHLFASAAAKIPEIWVNTCENSVKIPEMWNAWCRTWMKDLRILAARKPPIPELNIYTRRSSS